MADPNIREIIKRNDLTAFKEALKKGFNTKTLEDTMKDTYLHYAAIFDKKGAITQLLLDSGTDPNAQNINGATPLIYAVINGVPIVIETIAVHKATNTNIADTNGNTALSYAGSMADLAKVSAILKNKKTQLEIMGNDNKTVLFRAVEDKAFDIAQKLLKKGAKIDVKNPETGNTLVHTTAITGNSKMLDLLLYWKADPEIVNNIGDTALHLSSYYGDNKLNITKKLIKKKPALGLKKGNNGMTPLHVAVSIKNSKETVESLLYYQNKAKDVLDDLNRTPKDIAMEMKNSDIVSLL